MVPGGIVPNPPPSNSSKALRSCLIRSSRCLACCGSVFLSGSGMRSLPGTGSFGLGKGFSFGKRDAGLNFCPGGTL